MTSGYNFGQLYGMADHSAGVLYDAGRRDAVVESAEYGMSKAGTKGQWTVKFRLSTGPMAGMRPLTTNISISPLKNDGSPNPFGVGRMFRELAALGVPVPDPDDPAHQRILNGTMPFWINPQTMQPYPEDGTSERYAAALMTGKACQVDVTQETWEQDGVTRNKIGGIHPPRPGAPTTWPQPQAQQPQPQGYPQAQQPWGQPGAQQPPAPQGQPYPQPSAQPPWQQPQVPGAPQWAQPGTPGQGGTAEFTQQGQSFQPSHMQPPAQPPWQGQPPQGQAPAQPPPVPQPPWQQFQGPQSPPAGYQGGPQAGGPQGQAGPQGPPQPPWQQQGPPGQQQGPPQQGQAPDPNQFPWTQ
jgi:hypothetical protein